VNVENIAEYQNIRIELNGIEKEIENLFRMLEKKQRIDFDRCSDYGERGFVLHLFFDQINIQALKEENIEKLKILLIKYDNLRTLQSRAEEKMNIDKSIEKSNKKTDIY